jgi:acetyl-CoA acetyltransferase
MSTAVVAGVGMTRFHRHPERTHADLAAEAVRAALADAGVEGGAVEAVFFGACGMATWGQANLKGTVALDPMLRAGELAETAPRVDVDAACATGAVALHAAIDAVRSGRADVALAVGVEKTFLPDPARIFALYAGGVDQLEPQRWQAFVADQAARYGHAWAPAPGRVVFVDMHALQAMHHRLRHGSTAEDLAWIAAKNHTAAVDNPHAQVRKRMTPDEVLADAPVIPPFTRAMCAPMSDGAAAVVITRPRGRARDLRVLATAVAGGRWRDLDSPDVTALAAARLWRGDHRPADVQLAEVHDATAFCELQATELLGLCPIGQGAAWARSGATSVDGAVPVNPSGGLESRGHPLAATGLAQIHELALQLRGEAGARQVRGAPRVALAHNEGGMIGVDHALCALTLLGAG